MITHRILALPTLVCFLLSLLAIGQEPMLVCRFTGKPMTVVRADSPKAHGSCCEVATDLDTDGTTHYTLTAPGCCDLTKGTAHSMVHAVSAPGVELPQAALLVALPRVPSAALTSLAPPLEVPRDSVPRAPPRTGASARAPPVVS